VTDKTNRSRLNAVLDVVVEGAPLREWPFDQLRRRHANLLVDHMFRVQGRAYTGVTNILGTLSAMTEDAIDDEAAVVNPFKGVKVRANDPRIQKQRRPVRVFSWADMHSFARACADATSGGPALNEWRRVYAEPMVRVLSDCGLRAGELLILCRSDLSMGDGTLEVRWSTNLGDVHQGTKTSHGVPGGGRVAPVPPDLLRMLDAMPKRIDGVVTRGESRERLLFPSPRGFLWGYADWWRYVWEPGREVSGMDIRPHECRHSWVSLMRAAGVDAADLAKAAGHTVDTATKSYTHALGRSFDAMREVVGE
jgi:integrase